MQVFHIRMKMTRSCTGILVQYFATLFFLSAIATWWFLSGCNMIVHDARCYIAQS